MPQIIFTFLLLVLAFSFLAFLSDIPNVRKFHGLKLGISLIPIAIYLSLTLALGISLILLELPCILLATSRNRLFRVLTHYCVTVSDSLMSTAQEQKRMQGTVITGFIKFVSQIRIYICN